MKWVAGNWGHDGWHFSWQSFSVVCPPLRQTCCWEHLIQLSMGCGHLSGGLWTSWSTVLWAPVTVIHECGHLSGGLWASWSTLLWAPDTVIHGMWPFIWQALDFMEHSSVSTWYSHPWDVAIYLAGSGLHGALLISLTYSLWRDLVPRCEYSAILCANEMIDLACVQ